MWNIKLTFVPVVTGSPGTIMKNVLKTLEIKVSVGTIQTTALSKKILRYEEEHWYIEEI